MGGTCGTGRTPWAWRIRTTTGSPATGWCTGSGCATAGPSGTATAGFVHGRSAWPAGRVHGGMDFAANTHVIANAGRVLATVDSGPLPYELSAELDTVGPC